MFDCLTMVASDRQCIKLLGYLLTSSPLHLDPLCINLGLHNFDNYYP